MNPQAAEKPVLNWIGLLIPCGMILIMAATNRFNKSDADDYLAFWGGVLILISLNPAFPCIRLPRPKGLLIDGVLWVWWLAATSIVICYALNPMAITYDGSGIGSPQWFVVAGYVLLAVGNLFYWGYRPGPASKRVDGTGGTTR